MTRSTHSTLHMICALLGGITAWPALANPRVSAPAPHPAMPAARAPMAMPRAPAMAPRAPMAAQHGTFQSARYPAPAARPMLASPNRPMPSHATAYAARAPAMQGHASGAQMHYANATMHASPHFEGAHEASRGGEGREGGRHEMARDDPARAHGHFDEHVRNPERARDIARVHGGDFHVHDVRQFNDHERQAWRGGYWHRDYYNGRFGWWFDVDGVYYPYAAPIWPYPLYVASLVVTDQTEAPPQAVNLPLLPALPRVAYHCASPPGFYPAVDTCDTGWMALAAH